MRVLPELNDRLLSGAASACGTPAYVYSLAGFRRRLALLEPLAPAGIGVRYAVKANRTLPLLEEVLEAGHGVEVSSAEDLEWVLAAGFDGREIVYTKPWLPEEDAALCRRYGVMPALGTRRDVSLWETHGQGLPCLLRIVRPPLRKLYHVNVGEPLPPKTGLEFQDAVQILKEAESRGLRVEGLHVHLGSEYSTLEPWEEVFTRLVPIFRDLRRLHVLDLGGGFAVPFTDEETEIDMGEFANSFQRFARDAVGREIQGLIEPGSYLTSSVGGILTRAVRVLPPRYGDDAWRVLLDASLNQWPGGTFWNAENPIRVISPRPGPRRRTWLFGQTSMDADRFGPPRMLPPVEEGDLLVIGNCGAYAAVRATRFNGLPAAPEIVVTEDGRLLAVAQYGRSLTLAGSSGTYGGPCEDEAPEAGCAAL